MLCKAWTSLVHLLYALFCDSISKHSGSINSLKAQERVSLRLQTFKHGGEIKCCTYFTNQKCSALQAPPPKSLNLSKVLPPLTGTFLGIDQFPQNLDPVAIQMHSVPKKVPNSWGKFVWLKCTCIMYWWVDATYWRWLVRSPSLLWSALSIWKIVTQIQLIVILELSFIKCLKGKTKTYHISAYMCVWSSQMPLLVVLWPWVAGSHQSFGWGTVMALSVFLHLSVGASLTVSLPLQLFCSSVILKPHCPPLHPVTFHFLSHHPFTAFLTYFFATHSLFFFSFSSWRNLSFCLYMPC